MRERQRERAGVEQFGAWNVIAAGIEKWRSSWISIYVCESLLENTCATAELLEAQQPGLTRCMYPRTLLASPFRLKWSTMQSTLEPASLPPLIPLPLRLFTKGSLPSSPTSRNPLTIHPISHYAIALLQSALRPRQLADQRKKQGCSWRFGLLRKLNAYGALSERPLLQASQRSLQRHLVGITQRRCRKNRAVLPSWVTWSFHSSMSSRRNGPSSLRVPRHHLFLINVL